MIIRTLKYALRVMKTLAETEKVSVYVCAELSDERTYVLNIFKDKSAFGEIMPLFLSEKRNSRFCDLVDCFSMRGFLYVLFEYNGGKPLLSLSELPLEQRLEYCRELAEYMVLLNMSPMLQASLLNEERVVIGDGGARFVYCFADELNVVADGYGDVFDAFVKLVQRLFSVELEMKYSEKLTRFCSRGARKADSYKELYERFGEIYDDLNSHIDDLVSGKPQFMALEKIKNAIPAIKRVLLAVLVAAAAGLAVYAIFAGGEKPEYVPITRIGTLVIEENDDTLSAEESFSEWELNGDEDL